MGKRRRKSSRRNFQSTPRRFLIGIGFVVLLHLPFAFFILVKMSHATERHPHDSTEQVVWAMSRTDTQLGGDARDFLALSDVLGCPLNPLGARESRHLYSKLYPEDIQGNKSGLDENACNRVFAAQENAILQQSLDLPLSPEMLQMQPARIPAVLRHAQHQSRIGFGDARADGEGAIIQTPWQATPVRPEIHISVLDASGHWRRIAAPELRKEDIQALAALTSPDGKGAQAPKPAATRTDLLKAMREDTGFRCAYRCFVEVTPLESSYGLYDSAQTEYRYRLREDTTASRMTSLFEEAPENALRERNQARAVIRRLAVEAIRRHQANAKERTAAPERYCIDIWR